LVRCLKNPATSKCGISKITGIGYSIARRTSPMRINRTIGFALLAGLT
jgi:hypothetical protein